MQATSSIDRGVVAMTAQQREAIHQRLHLHAWAPDEEQALLEIRSRLHSEISAAPRYKEVIGDRKLIRFFRGHNKDINKTCEMVAKFLRWRREAGVDEIRKNIVEHGLNHPRLFPKADIILKLIPQIVINVDMRDRNGCPMCLEQYNFSPSNVLQKITLQDYVTFMTYALEYKSLILEQLSEEQERKNLAAIYEKHAADPEVTPQLSIPPYGVTLNTCIIRDLNGIGFEHLGSQGQDIIKAVMGVASDNYPEMMSKCHMINAPWVFNTAWWVIKGWLSERTVAKISVMGSDYISQLTAKDIDISQLPAAIGGRYPEGSQDGRPFIFDYEHEDSLLYMPDTRVLAIPTPVPSEPGTEDK